MRVLLRALFFCVSALADGYRVGAYIAVMESFRLLDKHAPALCVCVLCVCVQIQISTVPANEIKAYFKVVTEILVRWSHHVTVT